MSSVTKKTKELVYDIHHKIGEKNFIENHPNLICNDIIISNCSRHAGGVIISENIDSCMPLINSGGTLQTPWTEGQNVRHLEPMGFIKFDILGLETLAMIESAIYHILKRHFGIKSPTFKDIKEYYDANLHTDVIDFDDQKVYENVFHNGKWAGIFQFTESGAQRFCQKAKPKSIIDLSAITSIYRPGPLCLSGKTKILKRKRKYSSKNEHSWIELSDLYEKFHSKDISGREQKYRFYLASMDEKTHTLIHKNKIKNVYESGEKEVFKILIEDRYKKIVEVPNLSSSKDHKFLTLNGWKTLEDLSTEDYICVIHEKKIKKEKKISSDKNINGTRNFKNICFENYQYKCIFCDWKEGSLDVNHILGNRYNDNSPENLSFMCPNHHRMYSEGSITPEEVKEAANSYRLANNEDFKFVRFAGSISCGIEKTYDIEMEAPHHNFIAGRCVVHNSADVDKNYIEAKERPHEIQYVHKAVRDVTEDTYGFLVFQEQIASIAHKLGKDISLEEGNQLRKVLTKKGTGKEAQVKNALYQRFIDGAVEKRVPKKKAEELWRTFEFFSGYGFNKSHAVCYSMISFQCAWLLTYYPVEWVAAFLDKTSDKEKEKAINIAKSLGFKIKNIDVNTSGDRWEIDSDGLTLVQPMTSIKGFGDAAYAEISNYRPFKSIDEFLFHPYMSYSKVNKKVLDVLCRVGALDNFVDERFSGLKHFWSAVAVDRPRNEKKFKENIEKYYQEGDFSEQEKIAFLTDLTGLFPINRVMSLDLMNKLEEKYIKPLGEYDPDLQFVWFIPRKIEVKKTKNGKTYWIVEVIDSTNIPNKIRCWSVRESDKLMLNRPYIAQLDYDEQWGFSTRNLSKNFRLIG